MTVRSFTAICRVRRSMLLDLGIQSFVPVDVGQTREDFLDAGMNGTGQLELDHGHDLRMRLSVPRTPKLHVAGVQLPSTHTWSITQS